MSRLIATITQIEKYESLHLVHFSCEEQHLSMMSLDLDEEIQIGTKVALAIKPSHIAIAKAFVGELSYSNQLKVKVSAIEQGTLLSMVTLACGNTTIESIITASASLAMNLHVGDEVLALMNASELSILEVLN